MSNPRVEHENTSSNSLSVRNVSKQYSDLQVLDGIALQAAPGEFVSIVGTSGCGKTTLLRIISGLEPATEGSVHVGADKVTGPNLSVGVAFQADRLMPWRTVAQNVALGTEMRRCRGRVSKSDVSGLLRLVGLEDFAERYPYQLSGGMRQRANLARALAINPSVLLLDEPFAALDAQTREVMQLELLRIWQETGKTVVFITHQIDEAVYLSDRVIVLKRRPGRVREDITIDLPRPRDLSIKRGGRFNSYVEHIWSQLETDLKAVQADELTAEREVRNG